MALERIPYHDLYAQSEFHQLQCILREHGREEFDILPVVQEGINVGYAMINTRTGWKTHCCFCDFDGTWRSTDQLFREDMPRQLARVSLSLGIEPIEALNNKEDHRKEGIGDSPPVFDPQIAVSVYSKKMQKEFTQAHKAEWGDTKWLDQQLYEAIYATQAQPNVYDYYQDILPAMVSLCETYDMSFSMMTRGHPAYQLEKVLRWKDQHPTLELSGIFLTMIHKGDFYPVIDKLLSQAEIPLPRYRVLLDDSEKEVRCAMSSHLPVIQIFRDDNLGRAVGEKSSFFRCIDLTKGSDELSTMLVEAYGQIFQR